MAKKATRKLLFVFSLNRMLSNEELKAFALVVERGAIFQHAGARTISFYAKSIETAENWFLANGLTANMVSRNGVRYE